MDDVELLTQLQGTAQVDPHFDDVALGHLVLCQIVHQGRQQLHPDQDIPAEAVLMGDNLMILITDHIGGSLQPGHQGELPYQFLHEAAEVGGDALVIHPLRPGVLDLPPRPVGS